MTSKHYTQDRRHREQVIANEIGFGRVIQIAVVDKGHRNGPEVHMVSTTGIVTVFNKRTGKMVTRLIARPAQLRRYFDEVPAELMEKAIDNARHGYYNVK